MLKNKVPNHLAIILDGNGRWAKSKGLVRSIGHKVGANTAKDIISYVFDKEVKVLSLFCFSTEKYKIPHKTKHVINMQPIKLKTILSRENVFFLLELKNSKLAYFLASSELLKEFKKEAPRSISLLFSSNSSITNLLPHMAQYTSFSPYA